MIHLLRSERMVLGLSGMVLILVGVSCPANVQGQAPRILSWGIVGDSVNLTWTGGAPAYRIETAYRLEAGQWSEAFVTKGTSATLPISQSSACFRITSLSPEAAADLVEEDPARKATLYRIRDLVVGQPGTDRAAERAAIAEFLKTIPELSDVIVQNGCVWARFPDGRLLTVVDNRLPPEEEQLLPRPLPLGRPEEARLRAAKLREAQADGGDFFTGIPESNKAYIFSSRLIANVFDGGPEHDVFDYRLASDLTSWLRDNGYDAVNWFPSLTALSQVKNAGVFYSEGHSGYGTVTRNGVPTQEWILVTDTTIEQSISATFQNDVGYAIYKSSKGVQYSVLKPFFGKYMTFGKKALVFLNGCHSWPAKDSFGAPTPVFVGWTESTLGSDAFRAGRYLFDRLLGANKARSLHPYTLDLAEDPPQRPFNYFHTHNAMSNAGLTTSQIEGHSPASLGIQSGDGFGILAPSIEGMHVDEATETLWISGLFDGEAKAATRVTLNERIALDVTSVSEKQIECSLPATLKPSVGNVQVQQRGHRSNSVPLTEWRVQGTLVKWFSVGIPSPSATTEVNLHFRAAVHETRLRPHTKPVHLGAWADIAKDSTARSVSASGTYYYPPGTAPGSVEWILKSPVEVPFSGMRGTLNIGADGQCQLTAGAFPGAKMTIVNRNGEGEETGRSMTDPGTRSFPPGETRMNFFDFLLQSGKGSAASDSGTFTWPYATPVNPPHGDYAR